MERTEGRFAHLLQPIRDLMKNWEIDVASELNDYLEELDDVCITFDGGKTRLNFAEAALLIQGSASIYSKKVEVLHSLVYQTLEYISDRNKKRSKQMAASQEDQSEGAESDHNADDAFVPHEVEAVNNSQKEDDDMMVEVAPLPPESLIAPESSEKNKLPLISLRGNIICSQKDFRINLFAPGEQDLILLTTGSAASRFLLVPHQDPQQREDDVEDNQGDTAEDFIPLEEVNMEQDQGQIQDQIQDRGQEEHVDRHQVQSEGRQIRERQQEDKRTEKTPEASAWTFSDPYTVLGGDKSFRSGKCYKVPDGLDDGGKRKRKRAAPLQDFRKWFRGAFDPPEQKFKNGPTMTDLNYIYLTTMKTKLRTQKKILRRAGMAASDDELMRTFLQLKEVGAQQGEEPVEGFVSPHLPGGDEDDDNYDDHEALPGDLPADFREASRDELSYEDLVKLRVEELVENCRGYTQETALSRKVKDWEERIQPELVLQEERSVFDIHDYGERIVRSLGAVGQRRTFSSIVSHLDAFEACKYLLASLQLANDYTVEVDSAEGLEDSVDSMGLTLLSVLKATDRFQNLDALS